MLSSFSVNPLVNALVQCDKYKYKMQLCLFIESYLLIDNVITTPILIVGDIARVKIMHNC